MGLFRKTVLTAHITYKGHDIVFYNDWSFVPFKSLATLKVDGVEVARSTDMSHLNPHKPLFSLKNLSTDLDSINVFFIGVFSVKSSIVVNGEVLHQDPIDAFDRMQARLFKS